MAAGVAAAQAPFAGAPAGSAEAVSEPPPTASTSGYTARTRARSDDAPSTRRHRVVLRTPSGVHPGAGPPILRGSSTRGALPRRAEPAGSCTREWSQTARSRGRSGTSWREPPPPRGPFTGKACAKQASRPPAVGNQRVQHGETHPHRAIAGIRLGSAGRRSVRWATVVASGAQLTHARGPLRSLTGDARPLIHVRSSSRARGRSVNT